MKQTEINKMKGEIALFLGFTLDEKKTWHFFYSQIEYHYLIPQPYGSDDNFEPEKHYYSIDDLNESLRFDKSFDWILPAWYHMKKIEQGSYTEPYKVAFGTAIQSGNKKACFELLCKVYQDIKSHQ